MSSLILNWITTLLLSRKYDLNLKSEIKTTNKKIIRSRKYVSIKPIIRHNFDVKPVILKLFYFSFWINVLFLAISGAISLLYTMGVFLWFFKYQLPSDWKVAPWPWIGILITNGFYLFFLIRFVSTYYKLSLRGQYRNGYLKLLFLDILTLNIFNIIGSLIFAMNKPPVLKMNDNYQITHRNFSFQILKDYLKLIFKIEILLLMVSLIMFLLSIITGYFIKGNSLKLFCLLVNGLSMLVLYGWSIPRMVGMVIIQKMFKNLWNESYNFYYLLTAIRFLVFTFGTYHLALLINFLNFTENTKEFILENW